MRDTVLGVESDRVPLSRQEIRRSESNRPDGFVSPHYGDGGWHATPGMDERIDWVPLKDRILVRVIYEQIPYARIIRPENAAVDEPSRRAIVLRVGTGKRILPTGEERECKSVKPGDEVVIGRYDDWASQSGEYVILQEADVRVIIRRD